jgi:TPR repeat protein
MCSPGFCWIPLHFPWFSLGFSQALALMLEEGKQGVPQDTDTALRWHLAAAEQGNALPLGGQKWWV